MISNHTSSVDQYVNRLHDSAAQGDVDGILNALQGAETRTICRIPDHLIFDFARHLCFVRYVEDKEPVAFLSGQFKQRYTRIQLRYIF